MTTYIIDSAITRARVQEIASERFGDLVKGVVDVEKRLLILGSELHIDAASELQEKYGSKSESVWGINLYPSAQGESFLEFDSMINLKPSLGNRTRGVDDQTVQDAIRSVVREKVSDSGI